MTLDDILPRQSFILITHAATALGFGEVMDWRQLLADQAQRWDGFEQQIVESYRTNTAMDRANKLMPTKAEMLKARQKADHDARWGRYKARLDDIIARAAAGEIALFGHLEGEGARLQIPTLDLADMRGEERGDGLFNQYFRWADVRISRADVLKLRDSLADKKQPGEQPEAEREDGPVLTSADLKRATSFLATALRANDRLTRGQAMQLLTANRLPWSGRGFKLTIWPSAREAAGLPSKGRGGRPPAKPVTP